MRRVSRKLGKGLALLGLLWATEAHGSTRAKPLVEVSAEQRYDGYDGAEGVANDLGANEYYTKVSPKVGFTLGGEELKLQAWYAADALYKAVRGTTGLDHRAHFLLQANTGPRTEVHSDAGFWKVQDPTSLPRLGVAQINRDVVYGSAALGGSYHFAEKWRVELDNRAEVAQILGVGLPVTVTETPIVALRHYFTERLNGAVHYRYQAFLGLPSVVGQGQTALASLDYRLSHTWTGRVQGGPAVYVGAHGHATPLPSAEGALDYHGEYSEFDLVAGHDLVGSLGYAVAAWADYGQATWAYHPWRNWRFYAGVGAFRNGLAPAGPGNFLGYSLGGGGAYSFTRDMSVELAGQRISQLATGADVLGQAVNVNRNIAAVRLTWAPAFDPKEL
jgi:hypothetical protein